MVKAHTVFGHLRRAKKNTKMLYLTKFGVAVINKLIPQLEVDWINMNF